MNLKNKNRPGYKKTKVGWIPEDWECVFLGEVTQKISDGIHTTPKYVEDSQYYFVNGNNLVNEQICIFKETKCVSKEEYIKYKKDLDDDTLLMSINGTIGSVAYYRGETVVLGKSAAYIKCRNTLNKHYTLNLLKSKKANNFYRGEWTGSTIKNLSLASLKAFPIPLPPLPEQEAIAEVLECWDDAIRNYEKKIEKKKNIKKGLMQRLLSGMQRLPGFKPRNSTERHGNKSDGIPEGWKEVQLGQFAEFAGGYGFPEELQGKEFGEIPFIKVSDMNLAGNEKYISRANNYVPMKTVISKRWKPLPKDSVVFAKVGAALLLNRRRILTKKTLIDNNMMGAIPKKINPYFLYLILLRYDFARLVQVGALPSVNQSDLKSIKLSLPSLLEQREISNVCFESENEINILEQKLTILKNQKKYLLNNLVTGTIRLPQFRPRNYTE